MFRRVILTNSTKDKIIEAAIELINEKGYKGATTREIAKRAEVNEVTLFRHFGSKKGIVEAVIDKYSYMDLLQDRIEKQITWDLEKDLKMFVHEAQTLLNHKKTLILLTLKEAGEFPELNELITFIPQKYKEILVDYFKKMTQTEKMRSIDISITAENFIFINFGYFLMKTRINPVEEMSIDDFVERNIEMFIQSIM